MLLKTYRLVFNDRASRRHVPQLSILSHERLLLLRQRLRQRLRSVQVRQRVGVRLSIKYLDALDLPYPLAQLLLAENRSMLIESHLNQFIIFDWLGRDLALLSNLPMTAWGNEYRKIDIPDRVNLIISPNT